MPELTLLKTARTLIENYNYSEPRLREAIPYINAFTGKRMVLKIGGSVLNDLKLLPHLIGDVVFMKKVGIDVILVHGGSRQLNKAMVKKGLKPEYVDGLRVTSKNVLDIAADCFYNISLIIKKEIEDRGYKGVIFDRNSGFVRSTLKNQNLGYVGEPKQVDVEKLYALSKDTIPIVSAITSGISSDDIGFNVNADNVAGIIASRIKAEKLILMTDVDGVMDNHHQLLSSLSVRETEELIENGIITGGMIPKVGTCLTALKNGTKKCHIVKGSVTSFIDEILTDKGVGTEFVPDESVANSMAI